MVINHLLTGMILQVSKCRDEGGKAGGCITGFLRAGCVGGGGVPGEPLGIFREDLGNIRED